MPSMKHTELLAALAARKGDGTWADIARLAGLHYDTIARIARGDMVPTMVVAERIIAAMDKLVRT